MTNHVKPSCPFSLSNQNSACIPRLLIRNVSPSETMLNILGIHKEQTTERSDGSVLKNYFVSEMTLCILIYINWRFERTFSI